MIKFKDFALIKRLKDDGMSKQQAIKASGLTWSVRKYWDYTLRRVKASLSAPYLLSKFVGRLFNSHF